MKHFLLKLKRLIGLEPATGDSNYEYPMEDYKNFLDNNKGFYNDGRSYNPMGKERRTYHPYPTASTVTGLTATTGW